MASNVHTKTGGGVNWPLLLRWLHLVPSTLRALCSISLGNIKEQCYINESSVYNRETIYSGSLPTTLTAVLVAKQGPFEDTGKHLDLGGGSTIPSPLICSHCYMDARETLLPSTLHRWVLWAVRGIPDLLLPFSNQSAMSGQVNSVLWGPFSV